MPIVEKSPDIPHMIDLDADVTVALSTNTKIVKLIAFLAILISKSSYNRCDDFKGPIPAEIT